MVCFKSPATGVFQLINLCIVLVNIILIKFCGKNNESTDFNTRNEIFENFDSQITIVNHTWAHYKVKSIQEVFVNFKFIYTKNLSMYFSIYFFLYCCLKFRSSALDSMNVMKTQFTEVLPNITISTSYVENLAFMFVFIWSK